jgi:hypothetical protein
MSEKSLSLDVDVSDWITLPHNSSHYLSSTNALTTNYRSTSQDCLQGFVNSGKFDLQRYKLPDPLAGTLQPYPYTTTGTILVFVHNSRWANDASAFAVSMGTVPVGWTISQPTMPTPTSVWYRSIYMFPDSYLETLNMGALAHELGHLFGLPHSYGRSNPISTPTLTIYTATPFVQTPTITPTVNAAYDSVWDVMSGGPIFGVPLNPLPGPKCPFVQSAQSSCLTGGLISNQKLIMGLIPSQQWAIVDSTNSTTVQVTLKALNDVPTPSPQETQKRIIIIPLANGDYYTVELRTTIGIYDQALPQIDYNKSGVIIHYVSIVNGQHRAEVRDIDFPSPTQPPGSSLNVFYNCKNNLGRNVNDAGAVFTEGEVFWDETNRIAITVVNTSQLEANIIVQTKDHAPYPSTCW